MFDKQFEQMLNIEHSEKAKTQSKQLIDQRIKTTQKKEMRQYYTVLCIATALTIILLISSLSSMTLPPQSVEMDKSVHIIDSVALKDADADKTYNLQSFFLLSTRHNDNTKWLLQLEKLLQNLVPTGSPNLDLSEHSADHLFVQYNNGQNVYYKILYGGSGTYFLDETNGQYFSSDPLHFIVRDHFKGLGLLGILILVAFFIIMVNIGRRFFNRIDTEQPSRKDSSLSTALLSLVSLATINIYGTVHFGLLGIFYFIFILLHSIYDYKRYKIKTSLAHFTFKTISIALFLIIIFKI
ncbi:hypothetical protein AEA09_16560 [Lysinibacillus contaminans]|uniref:Uncharacterized protein n=1 Tax=Lysinibacillus contaminans TaxID=1293441 RepID=A0ABR5JW22_9BACI|nr:hypothetical protein [Lysinibacillus contaminans]KOS66361.1 hypothetical protein AEA09_16560 [Lysinibacillus contaminans]